MTSFVVADITPSPFLVVNLKVYGVLAESKELVQVFVFDQLLAVLFETLRKYIPDDPDARLTGSEEAWIVIEVVVIPSYVAPAGALIAVYLAFARIKTGVRAPFPFIVTILNIYGVLAESPVLVQTLVFNHPLCVKDFVVFSNKIPDDPKERLVGWLKECIVIVLVVGVSNDAAVTVSMDVYFDTPESVVDKVPSPFLVLILNE